MAGRDRFHRLLSLENEFSKRMSMWILRLRNGIIFRSRETKALLGRSPTDLAENCAYRWDSEWSVLCDAGVMVG